MTKTYHHYDKNTYFNESEVNYTFDRVLSLSDDEFTQWIKDVRAKIIEIWDEHGIPPLNGYSRQEIIDQFNKLESHNTLDMFVLDELELDAYDTLAEKREARKTLDRLCIRNTHNKLGNACNSWFPTMMKTKIDYGNGEARSIYDYLARDDLLDAYMPYGRRHFKRDSFYAYSKCVKKHDTLPSIPKLAIDNAVEYIEKFNEFERKYDKNDFWISAKKKDKLGYTGYNEDLINTSFLELTLDELNQLRADNQISDKQVSNITEEQFSDDFVYQIRVYDKSSKMFPVGLKSFRISVCQYAVNFPPVIAKALWERYTEEFKHEDKVFVWDPSSGWGGRLLGAMSVRDDRNLFYLGCDPNTDHTLPDGKTKYDDLATFYNSETSRVNCLLPHTHEWKVWQSGSEVLQSNEAFKQHKGQVSVVFTSPPYFHREVYSEDTTQSCYAYSQYEDWRDTFLYETLKTAYEWLRPGGYILWNIADIKEKITIDDVTFEHIPLEADSCDIMENLGFEEVETLKLVLGQMPGGNRTKTDEDGNVLSTNKNSVKINGSYYRYEPIFVYRKPADAEE